MATWYISPSGNDTTGNGTSGNRYATLKKCHTVGASGDTIIMGAGTYTHSDNSMGYYMSKNFTILGESAPTELYGVQTWSTIIDAGNAAWGLGPQSSDISLTIKNIEFRNYKNTAPGSDYVFGIGAGAGTGQLTSLDLQYCKFKNWGITSSYASGGVIAGSLSNDNGMTWTVRNNIFEDIYDTNNGGVSYIFGIRNGSGHTVNVYNNTFYLTRTVSTELLDGLLYVAISSSTLNWKNNIVYNTTSIPFYGSGSFSTVNLNTNCHYQMSSVPSGTGNITSDPLFVDPASGNFNLRPSSPAIGIGTVI